MGPIEVDTLWGVLGKAGGGLPLKIGIVWGSPCDWQNVNTRLPREAPRKRQIGGPRVEHGLGFLCIPIMGPKFYPGARDVGATPLISSFQDFGHWKGSHNVEANCQAEVTLLPFCRLFRLFGVFCISRNPEMTLAGLLGWPASKPGLELWIPASPLKWCQLGKSRGYHPS